VSELTDRAIRFADHWHDWLEHRSLARELVAEIERLEAEVDYHRRQWDRRYRAAMELREAVQQTEKSIQAAEAKEGGNYE